MISVLFVDDEPPLLDITQIFLEKDGRMQVTLSESARDALVKLESGIYDIIVSDYEMPEMNGIDFLKAVKARNLNLPFIIFTGRGREHVAIEALNFGASFYLQKGGDPKSQFAELRNMIVQAVERKKAEEEVRLNERRLATMIDLYQMTRATAGELCDFALRKAIELTGSKAGYIGFLNEQENRISLFTLQGGFPGGSGNPANMAEIDVKDSGLLSEPARQRRPIITSSPLESRRGSPVPGVDLERHLGVPIFEGNHMVMLVGLGNKDSGYEEADSRQVTHLMGGLWQILKRKRTEGDLFESERRLRSYFELPLIGIAIISPDMRFLSVNDKLCQILGYLREEMQNCTWMDINPLVDQETGEPVFHSPAPGDKSPEPVEGKLRRKDGTLVDVEISALPVRKSNGEMDYFVALIKDVSPLKRAKEQLMESNAQMAATLEELRRAKESLDGYCRRLEQEEDALRRSEERYRELVNDLPDIIFTTDSKGTITFMNQAGLVALELPEEEVIGRSHERFLHPGDLEAGRSIFEGLVCTGKPVLNFECRFISGAGKGRTFPVIHNVSAVRNREGLITGTRGIALDITEKKKTEDELRRNEARIRQIAEQIPGSLWTTDEHLVFATFLGAGLADTGLSTNQLAGTPVEDFFGDPSGSSEALDAHRRALSGESVTYQFGYAGRTYSSHLEPLRDERGSIAGTLGIAFDITPLQKAEEALEESELLLRTFVNAIPEPAILIDSQGFILSANSASSVRFGNKAGTIIGKNVFDLQENKGTEVGREKTWEVFRTGIPVRFEEASDECWYLNGIYPVTNNQGKVTRAAVFSMDITDRKKAELQTAHFNRSLNLLSRITSQDACNRLNVLQGYLALLQEQTSDPLLLTYARKGERAADTIRNLLSFMEHYQGLGMQSSSWQDVSGAIRRSAAMLDLQTVIICMDTSGLEVFADPLLEKVFYNLIENSLRYGKKITRITFSSRETGDGLILVCEDDGTGIPECEKEKVFDPGYGTNAGYGLFLVREILSITQFSIRETGEEGKGACFEIHIPPGNFRFTGQT
jgi:PAS domain S-box-containing protein